MQQSYICFVTLYRVESYTNCLHMLVADITTGHLLLQMLLYSGTSEK